MIRTLEQRLVYENDYVRVFDDRVAFPDGHEGTYFHTRWKSPYGVGVVPLVGNRVLLIRSYRYSEGAESLEIPMGFGVRERSPLEQAAAELREETGLRAGSMDELLCLGGRYRTHIFLARIGEGQCVDLSRQERTEAITGYEWLGVDELRPDRLAARGIYEPMTMAALLSVPPRL